MRRLRPRPGGFRPAGQVGDTWICADCDAARNLDVLLDL
jgi:hypothetical protein